MTSALHESTLRTVRNHLWGVATAFILMSSTAFIGGHIMLDYIWVYGADHFSVFVHSGAIDEQSVRANGMSEDGLDLYNSFVRPPIIAMKHAVTTFSAIAVFVATYPAWLASRANKALRQSGQERTDGGVVADWHRH
jgi:hypothetical protein